MPDSSAAPVVTQVWFSWRPRDIATYRFWRLSTPVMRVWVESTVMPWAEWLVPA